MQTRKSVIAVFWVALIFVILAKDLWLVGRSGVSAFWGCDYNWRTFQIVSVTTLIGIIIWCCDGWKSMGTLPIEYRKVLAALMWIAIIACIVWGLFSWRGNERSAGTSQPLVVATPQVNSTALVSNQYVLFPHQMLELKIERGHSLCWETSGVVRVRRFNLRGEALPPYIITPADDPTADRYPNVDTPRLILESVDQNKIVVDTHSYKVPPRD